MQESLVCNTRDRQMQEEIDGLAESDRELSVIYTSDNSDNSDGADMVCPKP